MQKTITFGEILMRFSPPDNLRFSQAGSFDMVYGGSAANVAYSLANYGMPVEFVTQLPNNDLGHRAVMEMRKRGVGTGNIIWGGSRLGIYFLETGATNRGSKVVYDRAHSALATIEAGSIDWEKIFDGADWFHWTGIGPALSQEVANVCLEAIHAANSLGITVSTDLNYRAKLWNYDKGPEEVMPQLVEGCDIILGNAIAAKKYFGLHSGLPGASIEAANRTSCKALMERFPRAQKVVSNLRWIINASHNSLSGVLYNGENFLEAPTYQITHMVDRVGGGDSFMGGLIYGLKTYKTDQQALEFAVAAFCLKHTIYGDANLATVSEVKKLISGSASGRISR